MEVTAALGVAVPEVRQRYRGGNGVLYERDVTRGKETEVVGVTWRRRGGAGWRGSLQFDVRDGAGATDRRCGGRQEHATYVMACPWVIARVCAETSRQGNKGFRGFTRSDKGLS